MADDLPPVELETIFQRKELTPEQGNAKEQAVRSNTKTGKPSQFSLYTKPTRDLGGNS